MANSGDLNGALALAGTMTHAIVVVGGMEDGGVFLPATGLPTAAPVITSPGKEKLFRRLASLASEDPTAPYQTGALLSPYLPIVQDYCISWSVVTAQYFRDQQAEFMSESMTAMYYGQAFATPTPTSTPTATPTDTPTVTPTATLAAGCPHVPNACYGAGKSILKLKGSPTDPAKRKFAWKWNKGEPPLTLDDLGDPVNGGTSYTLCVYDQTGGSPVFKMGATVGSGSMWSALGSTGWVYKNSAGNASGITKLSLKSGGAGKSKVQVKGAGASLPLPAPISGSEFFDQDTAVIVQLYSSSPANCWSSAFDGSSTKKNDGVQFKAVTQ